ncbi:hypothetical protein [Tuwongella immobilis]|uniref:Uncharacterized protein n=1 Tax=Tuwongella immobilis TaxID=692036 RepID=A0A6C2YIF2_9BACT|nr:hypothetical protein [Tuwongella immobilis]VIP01197.1 Uncharacterized protein OS=Acinetobacter guillouiae NIPH 991 GN=F964_02999 PE=4 SV=1 [Tuwongella immobilis]VTR97820.1 Uncharacterized protein OS=Acinetobacter guillouiae NIPH 991 GN=F964_02999 PE=4 SV=1 [Tuwongella immobilis]
MDKAPLTEFEPDPERLAVIRECMEHYDVGDPTAEWPNNIISRRTVVYGSGQIAREGAPVRHAVDADELARCRELAAEVAELMAGVPVGMGSESGDAFQGFFIAGSVGEPVPASIDEALIRSRFGGTIFPPATITIEPLAEGTNWWSAVEQNESESEDEPFGPWRAMLQWFGERPEFVSTAFVQIGDQGALEDLPREQWPEGTEITGCVLPRLAIGLTAGGSIVGLFGYTVQT